MNGRGKGRLGMILVLAGLWLVAIVVRLVHVQVERHEHYADQAARQQQTSITLHTPRGTVFDRTGRPLAVTVPVDSAYAEPRRVTDPAATARAVAGVLPGVDVEELGRRLAGDAASVVVARKLDAPRAAALKALDLDGLYFIEETRRYYPNRELAASVLGFVGTDDLGLRGLEQRWDEVVRGHPYRRSVLRDARRATAALEGSQAGDPGRDLVLTLDATLQWVAEAELARTVERHGALGGTVVMLDPHSGAVLAMASNPGFDPNHFDRYPEATWRNRAVEIPYEPGSTFKLVTAATALSVNLVDPTDVFDCLLGEIWIDGRRIRDHKPFTELTFRQVMAKSSNVGAIQAGLRVGGSRLHDMIQAFGFGRPTGIDLPQERAGVVHAMADRQRLRTAYVSFGQGISATTLQLASAFAAVANGGTLYQPHVVAAVEAGRGEPRWERPPRALDRPLHPSTARELGRILETVVEPGGSGTAAAIPGYRVAGKTGTAQVVPEGEVGYSDSHFIASFAGWAPARDPKLVVVVVIDRPRLPHYHGGQVAAPAFRAITERALLYLGVPPSWPERQPVDGPWLRGGVQLGSLELPGVGQGAAAHPPRGGPPDLVGGGP